QTLLDEERSLLLQGKLDALPDLLERKRDLVEGLGEPGEADLTDLHSKLTRNHALLNSAMEGIQRVSERLATLKRMRLSLETYDSQGHRQSLDTRAVSRMEKRA
ncbi:MAG: flagellar biosynthesis protein FlgN, partial [Rhodobacteraceae bacterium]|nr:flagellar biosynthesis protein FlgN [Paracoccaceae bacterium]